MDNVMSSEVSTTPVCLIHADRSGTPCPRCGTFRCSECLASGVCTSCLGKDATSRPPMAEEVASFGRRAGGRIIDIIASQLVALIAGIFAGIVIAILQQLGAARPGALVELGKLGFGFHFLSGSTASLLSATVSTVVCGASIGKAILGLRVVGTDGGRPRLSGAFVRELLYFVDALFFGLVGKAAMDGSVLAQRHGDRLGRTVVIRSDAATGSARVSTARMVVGLGLGALVYGLVLAAFLIGSAL